MRLKVPALTVALTSLAVVGCGSAQTKTVTAAAAPVTSSATSSATSPSSPSSTTTSSTTQAIPQAEAGKIYLRDIAPANRAITTLGDETNSSTSTAQLQQDAKPVVNADEILDEKLLNLAQQYPKASSDLKTLVTADAAYSAELSDTADLTASQLTQTQARVGAAVNIVRSDLGLPQLKQG
jgi:hypothetical protein